jgi:uncharacterized damage-inducible protein DinB
MTNAIQAQFGTSFGFLQTNLTGFDASNSFQTPEQGGNSAAYLLSHLVAARQMPLAFSGQATLWNQQKLGRWARSAAPLAEDERPDWNALKADLEQSQGALMQFLSSLTPEALERPTPVGTLGKTLLFLATHEAYHVGQLAMLRRALGMEGMLK